MNENLDNVLTLIGNLIWFGAWLYIIFGLNQSGWWILIPIIIYFKTTKK